MISIYQKKTKIRRFAVIFDFYETADILVEANELFYVVWDHNDRNNVYVYDSKGVFLYKLTGHTGEVTSVTHLPYLNQIATISQDNTVRFWSTDVWHPKISSQCVETFLKVENKPLKKSSKDRTYAPLVAMMKTEEIETDPRSVLTISHDLKGIVLKEIKKGILVFGTNTYEMSVWSLENGKLLRSLEPTKIVDDDTKDADQALNNAEYVQINRPWIHWKHPYTATLDFNRYFVHEEGFVSVETEEKVTTDFPRSTPRVWYLNSMLLTLEKKKLIVCNLNTKKTFTCEEPIHKVHYICSLEENRFAASISDENSNELPYKFRVYVWDQNGKKLYDL